MQFSPLPHDRRRFLRLATGFSTGALLAGCGGGGGGAVGAGGEPVAVVTAPVTVVPAPVPVAAGPAHPLTLALTLAYLGAQYYSIAARGVGLEPRLTAGNGSAGMASGGRRVAFTDPTIAALAAELADEKIAQVAALRAAIGAAVAAQPMIDLSGTATGAFSIAAQRAGLVGGGQAFDPYANDGAFLIGGFLIENAVAASYRTLLLAGVDDASTAAANTQLGDAIYHGGLIRALLDDRAASDPAIAASVAKAGAMLAALDGTNIGDQSLAGDGASTNLLDADGRPIPFTRAASQVLNTLYLSGSGIGGFLPMGANGIA